MKMPDLGEVKLEVLSLIKEFCKLDENVLSYTPVLGLYLFPPHSFLPIQHCQQH